MLVAIALLSAVLAAATLSMHTIYRASDQMHDALATQRQLERLATDLRTDAHAAEAATVNRDGAGGQPETLQLALSDDRIVRYTARPEGFVRTVLGADQVQQRETYRLAPVTEARWQVQTERPTPLVSLTFRVATGAPAHANDAAPAQHIAAAVGIAAPKQTTREP
jgi:type II secretory pathway component PulJ